MDELIKKILELKETAPKKYKEFFCGYETYLYRQEHDMIPVFGAIEGIYENGIVFSVETAGGAKYDDYWGYVVIIKNGCEPITIKSATGMWPLPENINTEQIEETKKELGQRIDTKMLKASKKNNFINNSIFALQMRKFEILVLNYFKQWQDFAEKEQSKKQK